ncbi:MULTISPECIES: 3-oxoacid CoA-transferase subunit B [Lacticaseibacillus]|uniref:3-oxoacid CoA-transferase subunit B n=4 Tax=Lacticaseibacillus TaxID=2759736 RepID=A0AAN1F0H0_LACCA|nr:MULTISPECIES: 3-oxoacid CoA-transferase subunit B [Lacticaseibacillus]ARY92472.1 succinyl-CoA--3-ketoacid-CoA transferase [Lacticaseibacillus casei]KAB1968229.1 3-oxoacid CoA-transferase subunit B [Lacticaseibacillus casei]KRK11728.1 acetyl-CoA acetoacetyl-CoA transferase subunit beta [Lacticaseibacillus zeae DSM 20178 = KCTC 3804]OLS10769.1 acetate CoA-transferase [Lacticaseibacillus casei]QVI31646.1 3-oxoacid CoA-transferase subunit B [Lacticaseibacillus zeae]
MISRTYIAKRVADELEDGQIVNLGIGIPTLVPKFISDDKHIIFQSENGIINIGPAPKPGEPENPNIFDAGGSPATIKPGGQFIDSAKAFGLIRSGKVDVTVLGAVQVDAQGNIANWIIPNKMLVGFGGAMDLVTCAKEVIVAMEHTAKGQIKILDECTFPLTGAHCVSKIITELAVFHITDHGMVLTEISPKTTLDEVRAKTGAHFTVADNLKVSQIADEAVEV